MATLGDLLARHTDLSGDAVEHLQRVVAEWQLLADLSFADYSLWVPGGDSGFVCVAHARPTTGPTAHSDDIVGELAPAETEPLLRQPFTTAMISRDDDPQFHSGVPVRSEAVPVRFGDEVIATLLRQTNLASTRVPSALEIAYLGCAADLCQMIADGTFPDPDSAAEPHSGPRAGDGLIRLGPDGVVSYASPNAVSAYHRMGLGGADLRGVALGPVMRELIPDPFTGADVVRLIDDSLNGEPGLRMELEAGGAVLLLRAVPLRPGGTAAGALVLVRDVTELRRKDRALISKDATIREIHHRVKNNLQTVAALLRLQARRSTSDEVRAALQESVRRVGSIALVHELLSGSVDERVDLDEVVDRVLRATGEINTTGQIRVRRDGRFGTLPAGSATPLVLVLTELVHNAIEHAYGPEGSGEVVVTARRSASTLEVRVLDDGRGLPIGFNATASDRLGLRIVNTVVDAELGGTLELIGREPQGAEAILRIPLGRAAG